MEEGVGERYGIGYLEERKLIQRWPQPIPAIVSLVLTLAVFTPRGGSSRTRGVG